MARQAWQLRVGDKVQYLKAGEPINSRKTVTSVDWVQGMEQIYIRLDEVAGTQTFGLLEEVIFPRRPAGGVKVHTNRDELFIKDLAVGDLVPPEFGWKNTPDGFGFRLSEGYQILQMVPFKVPTTGMTYGWRIVYQCETATYQRVVAEIDPRFYGEGSMRRDFDQPIMAKTLENTPKVSANVSGVYRQKDTRDLATFRLANRAGRPPLGSRVPPTRVEWENWEFIGPGQRHPSEIKWYQAVAKREAKKLLPKSPEPHPEGEPLDFPNRVN